MESASFVALLHGPDKKGIVARVAGWIHDNGGNVLHADQHLDREANVFFQRVEWDHPEDPAGAAEAFVAMATADLGMTVRVVPSGVRPGIVLMVSKADHCFHDLALRGKAGELHGEIRGVVSNHADLADVAGNYNLPFLHVPVDKENKREAESRQLAFCREHDAGLLVLARYMQVLSSEFLGAIECPVINIHHSFLPSFAGAKPYHQAYQRGVKIIGATAHYVTPELDQGPIIAQDVARVSHRNDVPGLVAKGKDLEKIVLATAVRWHLENRILVYQNKTVVFD
ncbi:MAG: formyltetrahydrofolate deformylase [Opitutae bacterium]|jgi:formyltetrahydrofolate deformylase|nr:formyltetrahydrofolate deformylase [Opitutae bacterium]|tara:strand:- start:1990 stop:2841 length:852 start_codon:yes stop_codon:yes gene_type:complete